MLSKYQNEQLLNVMKDSISGVVLRNDLKDWLLNLQEQNTQFLSNCEGIDLINAAKKLGIKVVNNKSEYNKIKDQYKCFYSIPNLQIKKQRELKENKSKLIDKGILQDLYYTKNLPYSVIAEECHVSLNTVVRSIQLYNFPTRNKTIQSKITKDILIEFYNKEKFSIPTIANIFKCGETTIRRYLEKFNLKEFN